MYRLLMTGDLMVGEETNKEKERVNKPVAELIDSLKTDMVLGNLEVPLTERGYPADKLIYWRSPQSTADDLKKMGFDMLSLATNHAVDYGVEGLLDTIEILDKKKIEWAGAGKNLHEALKPILIDKCEGKKFAIFSVSSTLPGNAAAGEHRPGAAPIRIRTLYEFDTKRLQERPGFPPNIITEPMDEDLQRTCRAIEDFKKRGYGVLVAIHWGNPYQKELSGYQRPLAQSLIESGCDFIIGHHPHTVHAIEVLQGVPVLYSIGNFIRTRRLDAISKTLWPSRNEKMWEMSLTALVAVLEIEDEGISKVELHPIVIDDGVPRLPSIDSAVRILKETEELSTEMIPWTISDGMGVIDL